MAALCNHLKVPGIVAELLVLHVLLPLGRGLVEECALHLQDVEDEPGPGADEVHQPGLLLDGGEHRLLKGEQPGPGEGEQAGRQLAFLVLGEQPGILS